jgi:hypothetical protein
VGYLPKHEFAAQLTLGFEIPKTLQQKYPSSVWFKRAIPWAA